MSSMTYRSHTKTLLLLLFVSILARVLYAQHQPQITLTPDSYIYYDLARNLFVEPSVKLVINPFKSPLYGLFLHLLLRVQGYVSAPPIDSSAFTVAMYMLLMTQAAVGIAGVIIFYFILVRLAFPPKIAAVVSLIHATNFLLIPWERVLLTETIAIALVLLLCVTLVHLFQKPTLLLFGMFLVISIMGVLLRPALLTVPLVMLVCLTLSHRTKHVIVSIVTITILYLAVPFAMVQLNNVNWHYNGLQTTGDINLLGKILQLHLPIESAKDHAYFYDIVTDYRSSELPLHPYWLLDSYDPTVYVNGEKLLELRAFTTTVLRHNALRYLWGSLIDVPKTLTDIDPIIAIRQNSPFALILTVPQRVNVLLQSILSLLLLWFPVGLFRLFFKRADRTEAFITTICGVAISQLILTTLLVYEEYGRLIAPVIPLLYLIGAYWIWRLLTSLYKWSPHD